MRDFCIKEWIKHYELAVKDAFFGRIEYIGIQGSYARNEAKEDSDIDVVVILDCLSYDDLKTYQKAISKLPYSEKICGFISGHSELRNWEKADLFQFYYDTVSVYGNCDWIAELLDESDVKNAILKDVCNVYHMCIHNALYEKSDVLLRQIIKLSAFAVKAIYFYHCGIYVKKTVDLMDKVSGRDKEILEISFKHISRLDFDETSESIMKWSGEYLCNENF